jgi:hypothetical protein
MVGESTGAATSGSCILCRAGTYGTGSGGQSQSDGCVASVIRQIGPTGNLDRTGVSACAALLCRALIRTGLGYIELMFFVVRRHFYWCMQSLSGWDILDKLRSTVA